jgi:prolyl oligopeptidase
MRAPDGKDVVLVDPHPLSPDHRLSATFMDVSPDGRLLAYGIRAGGEDEIEPHLLDVDTKAAVADRLPKGRYSGLSIAADRRTLYYSLRTAAGPRVFTHAMGADPAGDKEIFGKGYTPDKIINVGLSPDGRYLLVEVHHGAAAKKVEIHVADLTKGTALQPLVSDLEARFSAYAAGDRIYLLTDWKAPNMRVLAADLKAPARENWREIVPEGSAPIEDLGAIGGRLFVRTLEDVKPRIRILDPDGKPLGELPVPGLGIVHGPSGTWTDPAAFFSFESFVQPPVLYRYDVATGKQEVWAKVTAPVQSQNVEVKQVWYASKDGTRIPMFVAHRRGLTLDGANPTLLTGYGGFNAAQLPSFSERAAWWIEQGGVFALPNLRGGSEFGETWHQAGMLERKQNVFDDFLAAAQWLVDNHYTRPAKLAISGRSNGGLLVGAALTQRPELFGAVICGYPLLDMVRYHRFLVASYWVPEYGSSEDPGQLKTLLAYSPYHHVKKGERYPAVLFITGDADTRVAPLHARKMAALLQAATGSDKPVLLHYDTKAGHVGAAPVYKTIEDLTTELLFLSGQLGIKPGP